MGSLGLLWSLESWMQPAPGEVATVSDPNRVFETPLFSCNFQLLSNGCLFIVFETGLTRTGKMGQSLNVGRKSEVHNRNNGTSDTPEEELAAAHLGSAPLALSQV